MARILLLPLPESGHINPTCKLARDLTRRGHQVSYLGLADVEEQVRSQGFDFVPIFAAVCPKGSTARYAQNGLTVADMVMGLAGEGAARPLQELAALLEALHPDLLIVDSVLRDLALVAHACRVRTLLLSTSLDDVRLDLRGPAAELATAELPRLLLCPRELDFPWAAARRGQVYIEPSVDLDRRETGEAVSESPGDERHLVYCSLGSHCHDYGASGRFFRTVVEAVGARPRWRLVLAVGACLAQLDARALPANVQAVAWARQLEVLRCSAVMIQHGGLGTIKECIALGVPMVVFPVTQDQPGNAARVVFHGLGVEGNFQEVTVAMVQDLVERTLADQSMRRNVAAMQQVFARSEASGAGGAAIERLLAGVPVTP